MSWVELKPVLPVLLEYVDVAMGRVAQTCREASDAVLDAKEAWRIALKCRYPLQDSADPRGALRDLTYEGGRPLSKSFRAGRIRAVRRARARKALPPESGYTFLVTLHGPVGPGERGRVFAGQQAQATFDRREGMWHLVLRNLLPSRLWLPLPVALLYTRPELLPDYPWVRTCHPPEPWPERLARVRCRFDTPVSCGVRVLHQGRVLERRQLPSLRLLVARDDLQGHHFFFDETPFERPRDHVRFFCVYVRVEPDAATVQRRCRELHDLWNRQSEGPSEAWQAAYEAPLSVECKIAMTIELSRTQTWF